MTLTQLIERLAEYSAIMGGDTEVRLMTQQEWPFENTIMGVVSGGEVNESEEDERVDEADVVYIVEGDQLGYGSKRAWNIAY